MALNGIIKIKVQLEDCKMWVNCPIFNLTDGGGKQTSFNPWFKKAESWSRPEVLWEFVPEMCCIKKLKVDSFFLTSLASENCYFSFNFVQLKGIVPHPKQ